MNGLGTSLVWGAVQVSLFCLVGAILYLLCRRRGPSAGALVALVAVLLVLGVSILALSPWPHWLELSPQSTDAVATAENPEPVVQLDDGASIRPVAKVDTGAIPPAPSAHSTIQDGRALWKAAWTGMVEGLQNPTQTPTEQGWHWPATLACLLLSGMAIGLVRLALGLATVRRYRRFSCPLDDPELTDLLAITQAELGCTRSIAIHETGALDAPAVVGWLRPLVLLPESWRDWTHDERRAVLAHEVAHIAHNDFASWVLAQVSLIANFYNPLVHWLVARLRIEQELAADGCGAKLTGGNQTYLTILAGMALRLDNRQASWAARPFLPARGTFLRRIEMLRDAKSVGQPQLAFVSRVLVVGVLSAAALIAAGVRTPLAGGGTNLISPYIAGPTDGEKTPITGEFIPPNAIMAVAIRVPDLLRQVGNKDLQAQIDEFSPLKQMGIHVADIEEVKLALTAPGPNVPGEQIYARSIKPFDWIAALRKTDPNQQEVEFNGVKYYKHSYRRNGGDQACYMPDERSIVEGSEARIRELIQSGGKTARPTWADGWDKFSGGQVVAMIEAETLAKLVNAERGGRNPNDPMFTLFAPLWENSKVAFLGVNLNKNLVITGKSESPSEEAAQKVSKNLQAVETFAENSLDALSKQLERAQLPNKEKDMFLQLLGVGKDLLKHVQITQQGTIVSVQTQSDKVGANTIAGLLIPAAQKMRMSASRMLARII